MTGPFTCGFGRYGIVAPLGGLCMKEKKKLKHEKAPQIINYEKTRKQPVGRLKFLAHCPNSSKPTHIIIESREQISREKYLHTIPDPSSLSSNK